MLKRGFNLTLLLAVLLLGITNVILSQSISAVTIPTSFADAGGSGTTGYPFATFVRILGWTANASSTAYIKFYNGSSNEYMYSSTGVWSNSTTYSNTNQPVVTIDASGNWSGWIYAKHNTSIALTFNLRAAKVGATSTNLTQTGISFTALSMTGAGNGGWIVRPSSPAVNKGIAAYSGGVVVGAYRTEDNSITEGYSYSSGGFKIAVPAGFIDSLVSYNDDGTRDQLFVGPWVIAAGAETDASIGGVQLGKGSASMLPTLIAGTVSQSVTVTVHGQASYTLTNTNVIVPSLWTWSQTTGDVVLTGSGSPTLDVSGDTVKVGGMALAGTDSIQIQINSITPPDSTDYFTFKVQTGVAPDSIFDLGTNPRTLVHGSPKPISEIKINDANGVNLLTGKYVTTRGIVSVASQFGGPGYIQDNGAGLAIYDSSVTNHVTIGDEIILVGIISPYSGLCELGSSFILQTVSTGNTVTPLDVTVTQIKNDGASGIENYEGLLVRVNTATVTDTFNTAISSWAVSGAGTNYRLHDATGYVDIRVDKDVNYANTPAPQGTFDVIGVVSQYKAASPYIGGYQMMPRFSADIISSGPLFATLPVESNLAPTSFTISWTTVNDGKTRLRYGTTTSYELGVLAPDDILRLSHSIDVTSLQPATIYHVQAFSVGSSSDTSTSSDLVVSTSSPLASTGQINVYFNKTVNTSVSIGELALGNQDLVSKIVTRITNAKRSIDLALYSLSGSSQGDAIANALVAAKNRGVKVRVICEHDNSTGSGFNIIRNNGIPIIDDAYDAVWNGQALSHNKFFIIDGRGGAPESVWVWGGSWNPTISGTTSDRQNSIEIQDLALAGAYTTEFNLMWGSDTDTPNASNSRFGARKSDIVPHNFIVNGTPVSVYFSPSDHTTAKICATMAKAQHSISSAILTFTRKDIADTLISKKNSGDKVRIVVDNNTDLGNQFSYLQSAGVDIHLAGGSGLLHHKYAVIDGDQITGHPYTVTGSHNWSNSAETSNDENTLIIQSARVANLYLQEFAARYYEAGGTDSIYSANSPLYSTNRTSIIFDSVVVAYSKVDSFIVSNNGNQPLSISGIAITNPRFTIDSTTATIGSVGSHKFMVTFSPTALGLQSGYIIISHNAPGTPDSIYVRGRGVGSPAFSVNFSTIDFDTVQMFESKLDSFVVTNTGNVALKISSTQSTNARFTVVPDTANIMPSDSQKFIVTFTPTAIGSQNGSIVLLHNAPSIHDTVKVQGVGMYPGTLSAAVSMREGWNMVSLPVSVPDGRRSVVFPTATSEGFAYETGYKQKDTLTMRKGYWLKSPSRIDTISGTPVASDTIPVMQRWNLIGSITEPVLASSITASPGTIQSVFYDYNGVYDTADTIQPGKAYWVKVSQAGSLYLSALSPAAKTLARTLPEGLNELEITDAEGHHQTLYFGEKQGDEVSDSQFELPPAPPIGAFDVRFNSNNLVEFHDKNIDNVVELPIKLQASKFPVALAWKVGSSQLYRYALDVSGDNQKKPIQLENQSQTHIGGKSTLLTLTISPVKPLPVKFALSQNYPNPFNPGTMINYDLPSAGYVSLKIYNIIGQEIAVLVDGEQEAGYKSVKFEMSDLPSGVYLYRLTAGSFTDMKKMILMK
jgi:phosphatidylserine/phosphatidylglycerophosphate/cardiolipin synthase-like enzyme